jgi:hypothetical protein
MIVVKNGIEYKKIEELTYDSIDNLTNEIHPNDVGYLYRNGFMLFEEQRLDADSEDEEDRILLQKVYLKFENIIHKNVLVQSETAGNTFDISPNYVFISPDASGVENRSAGAQGRIGLNLGDFSPDDICPIWIRYTAPRFCRHGRYFPLMISIDYMAEY